GAGEKQGGEGDPHQGGGEEQRARGRGLPPGQPRGGPDPAARPGPSRPDKDPGGSGGARPDQGDHAGGQPDQREQQVTEDRSGAAAAEGSRSLQPRVHEGVDREQDDQRENRDVGPGDGDDPDDDGEDAEQDQ